VADSSYDNCRLGIPQSVRLPPTCGLKDRIGYRADMRVNALDVPQNVEMRGARFDAFRSTFASAQASSAVRTCVFSLMSLRAILTSPLMKTLKARLKLSIMSLWKSASSFAAGASRTQVKIGLKMAIMTQFTMGTPPGSN
jgi:hypothetical protein